MIFCFAAANDTKDAIEKSVTEGEAIANSQYLAEIRGIGKVPLITPPLKMTVTLQNKSVVLDVGTWETKPGFKQNQNFKREESKSFYRIGKSEKQG